MTSIARPLPILLAAGLVAGLVACGGAGDPGLQGLDVQPLPDTRPDVGGDRHDAADLDEPSLDLPAEPGADGLADSELADPGPDLVDGARIVVPASVDFGFVGAGISAPRSLIVRNGGTSPLTVSQVLLPQDSNGEFTVDAGAVLSGPIAGGATAQIVVTATNLGPESGTIDGVLRILSDDPESPSVEVVLSGHRAAAPSCQIAVLPTGFSLDTVTAGHVVQRTISVRNTGTGGLVIQDVQAFDCSGTTGGTQCSEQVGLSGSWSVRLADGESPLVEAGGSAALTMTFQAPAGVADGGEDRFGRFALTWSCPYGSSNPKTFFWPEDCAPGESCPPNLDATVVPGSLKVDPAPIGFPETVAECATSRRDVALRNTGNATMQISGIGIDPACPNPGDFALQDLPTLPIDLAPQGGFSVTAVFQPTAAGDRSCNLRIVYSAGAQDEVLVPLSGTSRSPIETVDRFVQVDRKADVLFVADTSGSMTDGIGRLIESLPTLTTAFVGNGTDPRFGIIGLSIEDACPTVGDLMGAPRILAPQSVDAFATTVYSMLNDAACDPSVMEAGLESVRLALSTPRLDDDGSSCVVDDTCDAPYRCVDGGCGGANRGFLRPDASLDVLVISDEDDQSPSTVNAYTTFLEGLKGTDGESLVRLHAVVGDSGTGCTNAFDTADAGTRYIHVADGTGGVFATICQADYDDVLTTIGQYPYQPRTVFPLSATPTAGTLSITVDGSPCSQGWTFDNAGKIVTFDPTGPCFPAPGVPVVATYIESCR